MHPSEPPIDAHRDMLLAAVAARLLRQRRVRDNIFATYPGLFQEPSWTILLEAFIYGVKGRNLSVSSATFATNAPSTTALRHVHDLEGAGLLQSFGDSRDRRRRYIVLSRDAERLVRQTLEWHLEHRS